MDVTQYLDEHVFVGLENLNDGFDAEQIKYFSENDFSIILSRVERLGLGIHGIEPWKNGAFYDVISCEDKMKAPSDPAWYKQAFEEFVALGEELQYSASYHVPDELLVQR